MGGFLFAQKSCSENFCLALDIQADRNRWMKQEVVSVLLMYLFFMSLESFDLDSISDTIITPLL